MSVEYTIKLMEERMKSEGLLSNEDIEAISNDTREYNRRLRKSLKDKGVKPFDSTSFDPFTVSEYIRGELGIESTPKDVERTYREIQETVNKPLPEELKAKITIHFSEILASAKYLKETERH